MIGINLIYSTNPAKSVALQSAIEGAKHSKDLLDFFSIGIPAKKVQLFAECFLPYPEYPVKIVSTPYYQYALEGRIYNSSEHKLQEDIKTCFTEKVLNVSRLSQIVLGFSGEFLLVIKTDTSFFFFNDSMGRLPVYFFRSDDFIYIGRSLYWLHQSTTLKLNSTSVFEFLWSSYALQYKTLYQDVSRIRPGSVIEINFHLNQVTLNKGTEYNFDERNEASIKENAERLRVSFETACERIAQTTSLPVNISLSGGQDSRSVALGMVKYSRNIFASSFTYPGSESDPLIAEKVAQLLRIPLKTYQINRDSDLEMFLLKMKMGLNYIGLSFLLDFYTQIRNATPGGFLYMTGDGGDKILTYLGEPRTNISFDQLVRHIAHRHTNIPISLVSKLVSIPEDDFMHHLSEIVRSYPEVSLNNKSIHYVLYERGHQSFFEGEDRNRHFFWSTSPFFDIDFFTQAMKIEDQQKKYYRLYKHFLNALSKEINTIPDALGYTIGHPRFKLIKGHHELFRATSPKIKQLIRSRGGLKKNTHEISVQEKQQCIYALKNKSSIGSVFDLDYLEYFLNKATKDQYYYLLTLSRLTEIF